MRRDNASSPNAANFLLSITFDSLKLSHRRVRDSQADANLTFFNGKNCSKRCIRWLLAPYRSVYIASEWPWQMGIKITLRYIPVFLFLQIFALQSVYIPTVKKSNIKLLYTYVKKPSQNHKWLIIICFRCTINTIHTYIHIRLLNC